MGFILYIISILSSLVILPIGLVTAPIILLIRFNKNEGDEYFRNLALSKDQHGNAAMSLLFNLVMIKKGGYTFGNIDETISSVFGKNEARGTLTAFGLIWSRLLNKLDHNHTSKSIDDTEDNKDK